MFIQPKCCIITMSMRKPLVELCFTLCCIYQSLTMDEQVTSTEFDVKDIRKIIILHELVKQRCAKLKEQLKRAHKLPESQLSFILAELEELTRKLTEVKQALRLESQA